MDLAGVSLVTHPAQMGGQPTELAIPLSSDMRKIFNCDFITKQNIMRQLSLSTCMPKAEASAKLLIFFFLWM